MMKVRVEVMPVKNEEISLNTKKSLAAALKRAMQRKPFQKITVSELIQDANVNRKTFYYHFEDIYALLKWMLEEEAIEVVEHFDLMVNSEEAIAFVMDYIEQNDHFVNCACDAIGRDGLKRFFDADFHSIQRSIIESAEKRTGARLDDHYREFLTQFYVEALSGMLIDWIRDREKRGRDEVIRYLTETMRDSLMGILTAASSRNSTIPIAQAPQAE